MIVVPGAWSRILRRALGATATDGAPYQIAVTTCGRCDRGWQTGGGAPIEVPAAVVDRARCDAVEIGRVDGDAPERATQTIPPAVRRLIWARFGGRCACRAAGTRPSSRSTTSATARTAAIAIR